MILSAPLALALLLTARPSSSNNYKMTIEKFGTASAVLKTSFGSDDSRKEMLRITLKQGLSVVQESTYNSKGAATRKTQFGYQNGKEISSSVTIISGRKAVMTSITAGQKSTNTFTAPKNASIENASHWWFIKNKPKVGDSVTYYEFAAEKKAWELDKIKYMGKKPIKVSGKNLMLHEVTSLQGLAYFDDKGTLFMLTFSGGKMEKVL